MTTADEDRIALRQANALRLRVRGYSFREIAAELAISLAVAHSDVRTAMGEVKKLSEDELQAERDLELHRVDAALRVVAKIMNGRAVTVVEAQAAGIEDADEAELLADADELKLKAVDRQVKLQDQRAKLLGLYAPTKQEHSGPDGAPIAVDDRRNLIERLAGLVAGAAAEGSTGSDPSKPDG